MSGPYMKQRSKLQVNLRLVDPESVRTPRGDIDTFAFTDNGTDYLGFHTNREMEAKKLEIKF